MKEVLAVIRMNMMNKTKVALANTGIYSFMATGSVLGRGQGKVDFQIMQGAAQGEEAAIEQLGEPRFVTKRLLKMVLPDDLVQKAVETIIKVNQTKSAGDGKIFVLPVDEAIRIRTGERGTIVLDEAVA